MYTSNFIVIFNYYKIKNVNNIKNIIRYKSHLNTVNSY